MEDVRRKLQNGVKQRTSKLPALLGEAPFRVSTFQAERRLSYTKTVKTIERNDEMVTAQKEPEQKMNRAEQYSYMDKKGFLAFIVMVIICAVEIKGEAERIKDDVGCCQDILEYCRYFRM